MTEKNYTEVTIGGKIYQLGGYEDREYLQRVAVYINGRISELTAMSGFVRQPADYQSVMIELNLADDYFKAKQRADMLEAKVEQLENEIYELKRKLVSHSISLETDKPGGS